LIKINNLCKQAQSINNGFAFIVRGQVSITLNKPSYIIQNVRSTINNWFASQKNQYLAIAFALFVSLIIRIYLSQIQGHEFDLSTFKTWSRGVYYTGFPHFYSGVGSDYPPFYIYILWALGTFYKSFISSSFDTPLFSIMLKIPAIIADIATAFLIFIVARKYASSKVAFLVMTSYTFNPAIIYDSAIWGQVDSVYTLFFMLALILFISDKPVLSGAAMALAVLTKPQSLVLVPLFAVVMMKKHTPLTIAKVSTASIAAFVIVALPFYIDSSIFGLFKLYFSSYIQYPYNSLNAFNLWAFTGLFQPDNTYLIVMTYRMWGYLLFGILFIYIAYITLKNKDDKSIYLASAILFFGFFMFFTRIHERYLFPVFAPLAVAITFDRRLSYVYGMATLTFLFNLHYVLEGTKSGFDFPYGKELMLFASGINLLLLFYTLYCFSTHNTIKSNPGSQKSYCDHPRVFEKNTLNDYHS
jgi:Gpi18-like mannosyltransferase